MRELNASSTLQRSPYHTNMKRISRVAIIAGPGVNASADGFSNNLKNASRCWFAHM